MVSLICVTFVVLDISVSDLLDYITPDAEMKAREAQRKQARAKVKHQLSHVLDICYHTFLCRLIS